MMQSAPIRRIAVTVLSRCCATKVSTVGTPVMSMMAIGAPVSTIRCQQRLHHDLRARELSSVPIIGKASTPSQSFTTGVESSSSSLLLPADDLLAAPLKGLDGVHPELVDQPQWPTRSRRPERRGLLVFFAQPREQRLL